MSTTDILTHTEAGVTTLTLNRVDKKNSLTRAMYSTLAEALQSEGLRTGIVGFCWGGTVVLLGNTRLGLPAVSYYGARNMPFIDEPLRAPMQFHFGERDRSIPATDVQLHRDRYPGATVHVYPAGHGFHCDLRDDHEPASAALAWQRTTDFFAENLR